MRTIAEPAGASFIFVYGPSGVGKTTLRLRVEQKLTELALPKLESDRKSPLLNWRSRPGYCSKCGEWLGANQCLKAFTDG